MIFDFIIVYQNDPSFNVREYLIERLDEALNNNLNVFENDAIERMLNFDFERRDEQTTDENGIIRQRIILGFSINMDDGTQSARIVIDEFTNSVQPDIEHILKFEDPLLRQDLVRWAEELFPLEMKLRRALSLIYLYAYKDIPYKLLREESVNIMNPPDDAHMQSVAENEFFFLTFGQYISLNHKSEVRQIPALTELIRNQLSYDSLKAEIERLPIQNEDDSEFITSLRSRMDPIEKMRNCVAHNRRPSENVINNYLTAYPLLDDALDDFLSRYSIEQIEIDAETIWETSLRESIKNILDSAVWDNESKTIQFYDPDEEHTTRHISTREELAIYISEIARNAFSSYVPREDGEDVYEFDEDEFTEQLLEDYNDRLATFFQEGQLTNY